MVRPPSRPRGIELAAAGLVLLLAWLVVYPIGIVALDAANGTALRAFVTQGG